jgi:hypothetical protein
VTVTEHLFGPASVERPVQAHRRDLGGTDVWLTPPSLLDALGPFDLDPCAASEPRPWPTAAEHYTADVDGLRQPWHGRCWVNPPYSDNEPWLSRLADHPSSSPTAHPTRRSSPVAALRAPTFT